MKLLWVGGAPGHIGGQSRVTYYVGRELQKLGVDLHCIGMGQAIIPEGEEPICPIHKGFDIKRAKETLYPTIAALNPDVILFSHDIWLFYFLPELRMTFPNIRILGWYTIDAHPIHASWFPLLRATHHTMVPSIFGKQTIYKRFAEKSVEVVQYGVNYEEFKLIEPKQSFRAKRRIFPEAMDDKCIFVFAGMNQVKKSIGAMIDAFMLYDNPDCHLVLAVKEIPCEIGGFSYRGDYELGDLAHHPRIHLILNCLENEELASLYKYSDFLLYPSQGESPGLQMAEAQLAGCVPIATNYTGLAEETCFPEFLVTDFVLHRGQFNCYRAIIGAQALATKMSEAFSYWSALYGQAIPGSGWTTESAIPRHFQFMTDVETKFRYRSWENTAMEIYNSMAAIVSGELLVDDTIEKL